MKSEEGKKPPQSYDEESDSPIICLAFICCNPCSALAIGGNGALAVAPKCVVSGKETTLGVLHQRNLLR